MERPRQSIFEEIKIPIGNSLGQNDSLVHEEETRGKFQKVCQVEECGINGPTTPHQSREKLHVRGHSTLPVL